MRPRILPLLLLATALPAATPPAPRAALHDDGRVTLQAAGDTLTLGPELFALRFADGSQVTAADLRRTAGPAFIGRPFEAGFTLTYQGASTRVVWSLGRRPGEPWYRVQLDVRAPQPVVACDVVRIGDIGARAAHGGFGQPWHVTDAWFAGVEYPASRQVMDGEVAVCRHAPGQAEFRSKPAVLGHRGADRRVEDAFESYVKAVGRPRRSLLQYNSWYDLRSKEMTVENFARIFRQFDQHLLKPYGLRFGAFVPDDGWQNRNSIWEVDRAILPDEFAPLARLLEAEGSRLGIWMPLNGTNLNTAWGRERGYEVSELTDRHYQLTGPKYNAALREVIARRIRDGNLAYFKHDFNNFRTRRSHPLGADVDFEENLDAELALLAYERELQPEIFLNVTSGMWLSPWWLLHADTIWMAASDFGYERTHPQASERDWDMSYRDQHFWRQYRVENLQFPLSRLMTHGIIHGRLNRLGGKQETLREWSDHVVMYFARGVQLKELYVTPDLLDETWWRVLGRAIQWAEAHAETLDHTRFVGGEPARGEVYGYVHWARDEGILVVRNPDVAPGHLTLGLDQRPTRLGGPQGWRVNRIYPDSGQIRGVVTADSAVAVPAPGQSVCLYHLTPERAMPGLVEPAPPVSGRASFEPAGTPTVSATVEVAEGALEPELQLIARTPSVPRLDSLTLNGEPATPRALISDLHAVWRVPLRPGTNRVVATLAAPDRLFRAREGTLAVWARSGVDVPLPPDREAQPAPLPPTVTVPLLREAPLAFPPPAGGISDEDLARPKAVRVRFEIFDSNGNPPYGGKQVLLDGRPVAAVPANPHDRFSAWHEVVIDLTPEQAGPLARTVQVAFTNPGGDLWKVRGVALAVQRPDGQWVPSAVDRRVLCWGAPPWIYSEGELWTGERSPAMEVTLPQ